MATFLNELPDWPDVEAELRKRNADAATVNQVRQRYWNDYSSTEEIKALPPIRTEAVKARFFGVPVTPVEPNLNLMERAAEADPTGLLRLSDTSARPAPAAPVTPDPVLNPDGSLSIAAPGPEPTFAPPTTPLPAVPANYHAPFAPQPGAPPIVQDVQSLGPYALATLQKVATLYPGAVEELVRKAKMAAREATGIGVRPHPAGFQTQMEAAPEDAIAAYRHKIDAAKEELAPKTKAGAAAQQATDVAGQIAEIVLPMIATGGAAGAVPGIAPEVAAALGPELAATTAVGRAAALRLASATAAGATQSAAEDLAAGQPVNVPKAEQAAAAMGTIEVGSLGGATAGAALAGVLDRKGLDAAANVMLKTGNAEKAAATLRKMVRAAGASKEVLEHVGGAVPNYMATLDQTGDKQKAFEQTVAMVAAGAIGRRFGPGLDQQAVERLSANPEPVFDAAKRYREAKQQAQGVAVAPEPPLGLPAGAEQPPAAPPRPPETPPGAPQEPPAAETRPSTPPEAGTPQEAPAPRPAAAIEADLKRALADPLMKNESDAGQAHRVVVADLEHELEFARAQAAPPQSAVTPNANAAVPAENGVDHGQVSGDEHGDGGGGGQGPGRPGGVDRPQEVRQAGVSGDGGQGPQGGIQAEAAGQPAEALPAKSVGQGGGQPVPEVAPAEPSTPPPADVVIKTRRDLGPLRVVDDSDPAKVTLALPAGGTLQVGRKAIESAPAALAPPAGNVVPAASAPPVEPPAASHAPLQYEPKAGLSDTQRAAETHLADILGDTETADAAYAAIPETHGGRVLNVDEVRKLSPEYSASLTGAAEHTLSTQKPAGNYIKGLYQRQLAKTDLPGNPRVVFLAGGAASGKTKATAKWVPREGGNAPQIIYDTTLGNLNRARQDIRAAVESGRGADIYLVHHPLDAAVKAMLRRTNTEGRYVPLDVMAADHRDAQESVLALAKEFAGDERVKISVVDNSLGRDNAVLHEGQDALDFLSGVRYNTADETSEQTAKRLESVAWRTYDEHHNTAHPAAQRILELEGVRRGGQSAGPLVRGLPEPSGARGDRGGRGQAPANAAPVPEPAGEVAHPTPVALGFEGTAKTPAGTAHPFRWAVFNAGDLITSHATSLNINPAFPAALQPRDRGRDAGKMQVERIAAKLDPELLGANPLTSDGAPVVGRDGVVESGNGRMIALRLVYQRGGALADGYRSWLKANAGGFGIDPDALDGVDQPVLVRMRKAPGETEQQRVEFTTESNQSNVDAQSASEKALSDARRMDQALMDQFQPSEDGDILTARNLPFIRSFMERVVGPTERGQYLLPGGQLNADGVTRVLNAVIARAYGDPNIVLRLAERTDDNVANLSRGITRAAGVWMRMRAGIEAGERHAVDVSPDLSRVIEIISSLRAEGTSIPDFLAQGSLFPEDRPTDLQKRILGTLDKHKRSGKRIGDILAAYADRVERAGDPRQPDIWGNVETPDPLVLWDKAVELVESGNWNGTPSLFDGPDHVGETAPTYNREEARDYFAKQRARIDAEVQRNLDAVGDKPFAIFASDGRSYVRLLHPDNSHPGGWRLTTFDERGPVGHYEFASKEDAIRSASGDGRHGVRADNVGAGGRDLSGWEPAVGDGTWRTVEQHPFVSEPRIDYKLDQGNLFEDQGDRTPRQASLFGPEDAQFEPIAKPSVPDAGPIPERGTQLSLFEDEETAITEAKRLAADKARGVRSLPLEPGVKETPSTYAAGPWQGAKTAADPSTLDEGDFITYDDWYNTTFAERKGAGGEVVDTNLTHPITTPNPPLGAWRIDRDPLNYGREIAQLRLLDPRALEFSEDPLREGRAAYVAQYREWAKQGMSPPPITVIEKLDGSGRIIDGHRRALAARDAGVYVPAWVYPAMPSGKTDSEGKPIEVGLTFEATRKGMPEGVAVHEAQAGYGAESAPLWYSKLERAIEDKLPARASAEQVRGVLRSAGVKPEEIEWTDIESYLKANPKVDKQALLDHLRANQVQVREVWKGGKGRVSRGIRQYLDGGRLPSTPEEWTALGGRLERTAQQWQANGDQRQANRYFELSHEAGDFAEGINPETGSTAGEPKFASYQLPGGENYRELLLTMPGNANRGDDVARLTEEAKSIGSAWANNQRHMTPELMRTNPQQYRERYDENAKIEARESEIQDELKRLAGVQYRSPHWDEPNVLAHVRMNDRMSFDVAPNAMQPKDGEPASDSLSADPHRFADLVEGSAFRAKGLRGLNVEDRQAVVTGVLAAVRDPEVARRVVGAVPVDVMNKLVEAKLSPEEFLSDQAMLSDSLSGNPDAAIRLGAGSVRALVRAVARFAAEEQARSPKLIGLPIQGSEAPGAGDVGLSHAPHRTLFLEEIQSDMHQKGREHGYQTPKPANLRAEQKDGYWEVTDGDGKFVTNVYNLDAKTAHEAIAEATRRVEWEPRRTDIRTVPDAPFKKTWPELVFKRMLRYAAENGYARVAWTTGSQQAERYDLSKQVASVTFDDHHSGGIAGAELDGPPEVGILQAFSHDGRMVVDERVEPDKIEDYIGKDAARKLLESTPSSSRSGGGLGVRRRAISGLDLKVGGEGMRGFYDAMLPSMVNKLVKRWGARVVQARVPVGSTKQDIGENVYVQYFGGADNGRWLVLDRKANPDDMPLAEFPTKAEATAYVEELDKLPQPTEVVHAVDITPEMTDTILHEGFAIFEPRKGYSHGRVPEQLFLPGFEPGGSEGDRVPGGAAPGSDQRPGDTGRGVLTGAGGADSGAGAVVPPRGRGPATGLQVDRGPAGAGGMEPGSAATGAQQPGGNRGELADRVVGPQQAAYEKQAQGRREAALRRLGVPKELLGDTAQALADLEAPIQDALPETTSSAARRKAALTSLAGKLERTGWVHYVGLKVANANDLAQLTQGLRDPRFETFRIWFVNDEGEILASRAVSSRVPNQSSALTANEASKSGPGEYVSAIVRMIGNIRRQMARLGATGFYLEHNHPSGDPTPSHNDVMLSRTLSEARLTPMSGGTEGLPGYRGHVIIDHETARILLPGATDKADSHLVMIRPENRVAKDVTLPPGVRAPINPSSAITHPRDLASIAASIQLNHSEGRATIIFTTNPGDVRGVAEFDEDSLTRKGFADTLAGMSRATGGGVIILVVNGNPESSKVYKWNNLVRDGVVADVIYPDLKTSAGLGWFASPKARDMWAGREAVKSAAATFEPSPAYGQLDGMATKWEGDITPERRLDAFVRVMQDRFVRMAKAQTAVEAATGQTLRDEEDAYLAEELRSGRTGARLDELEHEQVDPLAKLVRLARKRGVTYDDVRQYLYARHAPERNVAVLAIDPENKAGSGMTNDEAAAIIDGFDKRGVLPALTEIGARADQITAAKLKGWVADGLMTQAQADAMRKKYPHYVPLKGRPGDEATAELMGPPRPHVGQGRDIRGQETKRALGRTTVATHDILSQLVMDAEEAIIRGEKNRVGQAFLRLVEDFPNPDVWEVNKVQMGKVLDRKTGKVKEVPETWSRNLDPSVIGVKRNGQQFYITMHDPLLARAMRNLGNAEVGTVFRALARVTRVYSAMRTSWNPEFLISNFMRDTGEASVNLSSEEYKSLGSEVRRNIGRAVAAIYGTERGHAWLAEWQQYWREFQEQGAKTSYINLRDLDNQQRRLATKIGGKGGAAWMATKDGALAIGKLIGDANDAVENGVRLAAYVAARKRGMSRGRAASLAKNLTVNFNRGGEAGPVISSAYAFANAGVQGVARMSKALKSKRVWKVLAALAAVAAAQALINGLFGGEDPEDGRRYWDKLSPQLKERNFIVMIPGTKGRYIRIPLPYGYSWASTAATALVDEVVLPLLDTRPTRRAFSVVSATTRTVNGLLNSFNPFSGVSLASVKEAVGSIIPSALKPAYGVAVNRTSMGSPIKPEQIPFGPPRPESELAFRGVSPVTRVLTRKVNSLTGGNAIRPGAVSVSPEVLDYAWDEAGGGIARLLRGTADTLTAAASGKAPDARQVPFVRGLVGQAGDYDVGGRFREAVNAIETAQRETKLYEGSERVALLVKDRKELRLGGLLKATDAQLTALRKIQNRRPNDEAIGQKITALQKQFLRRYQESLNK